MSNANTNQRMLSGAVLAMLDQALLSGINFAIGLSFIRLTDKTDYGLYTQFFALLLLSQATQNALSNAPLVSIGARRRARGMQAMAAHLFRMQTVASLGLAIIAFSGVHLSVGIGLLPELPTALALPFAAAIIGQWVREFARKYSFIRLEPGRALATDTLFAVLLLILLLAGIAMDQFGTAWVLGAMGLSHLIAGMVELQHARLKPLSAHGHWRPQLSAAWEKSRWSLPSVIVGWGSNYSFVYVVAAIGGVAAAAEISAARLLMMPAGLVVIAWCNTFSPRIARWVGARDFSTLRRIVSYSLAALVLIILGYAGVLALSFDLLITWVIGADYASVLGMSMWWALYFCVNAIRKIGNACLVGDGRFRELFHYSWITFVIGLPATVALTLQFGSVGSIIGLIVTEVLEIALTWMHGWKKVRAAVD